MSDIAPSEQVIWTPQMPDRRKSDRRGGARDIKTNGKIINIANLTSEDERRRVRDRRVKLTITITGRAMDVNE